MLSYFEHVYYFGAWADGIICFCDLTKLWLSDSKGDVLLDSYQQFRMHDASLNSNGREREKLSEVNDSGILKTNLAGC